MKFTAYISIFSMLLSSFSYAGSSARLLKTVSSDQKNAILTPPTSKPSVNRFAPQKNYNVKTNNFDNQTGHGRDSSSDSEDGQNVGGSSNGQSLSGAQAGDLSPFPNGRSTNSKNNLVGQSNSNSGTGSGSGSSDGGGRTPPPDGGSNGEPPPESDLKQLPYWLPVCFFFDSHFSEDYARQAIKQVVDNYAYCGIAIDVHSKTLKAGSFPPDDPEAQQTAAAYHCNARESYTGNDIKFQAAQSYPNSERASDYLCDDKKTIEDKEHRGKPWNVAGCAQQPGEFSVVDRIGSGQAAGGVGTHELGHNTGRPGRGGDELENEGGGGGKGGTVTGKMKTKAGVGLQGKNTPETDEIAPPHDEGSHGVGDKFTEFGCASIRGGANDNSERKIMYDPNALASYYEKDTDPNNQLEFKPSGEKFLPGRNETKISGNQEPPKPQGEARQIRSSDGSGAGASSADPGHKKGTSIANNSNRKGSGSGGSGSGSSDPSSSSDPTRRGDDSPLPQGSAVGGGTGGPGSESSTIVANDNNTNSDGGNPTLDSKFFESKAGQTASSGASSVSDRIGNSRSGSEGSESTNPLLVNRVNSENGSDNGFFTENSKTKPEQNQLARKDARKGYDEKAPEVSNRAPASIKNPTRLPQGINNSVVDGARKPRKGGI